ncbi:MAG: DUF4296 domain-containing protein [Prolixibacteraceae bacterium]|jgi:hypothetical protein|nr:DUF4296 domain-containing protein [Prolixibacteraceae bacterium]
MKFKIIITSLLFVLVLSSCQRDPLPKNAIERDKYIGVLVDVHIAQALYTDRLRINIDSIESEPLYMSVLDKHGVTEDEMAATTRFYTRNPRKFDKVYAEVLSQISLKLEEGKEEKENIQINK